MTPIVIGVDPSLSSTGLAWGDQLAVTKDAGGDRRLRGIYDQVRAIAEGAHLAVVEDLPTHAKGAGLTGMSQGVVRMALLDAGVPYALVVASTLKKFATGKGNATKPDMRMEMFKRTGLDVRDDNKVDAWWLRALGMQFVGHPLVVLPKAQRDQVSVVIWPELLVALGGAA